MTAAAIRLVRRGDGTAILRIDTPGSPVNLVTEALIGAFPPLLDEIEQDATIRAVVLASGKPGTFIAGADIRQLRTIETADAARDLSKRGQSLCDRLEDFPKPIVAAIHGPALGAGLELALACSYRLAADDPKTVLALPEVQLGLLPGAGGTQRLPRLIGLTAALPLLLSGRRVRAGEALRLGLVDALTSPGGLEETAARAALRLADGTLTTRPKKTPLSAWLAEGPLFRGTVFGKARASVAAKSRGLYPAPPAILDCVERGMVNGTHAGLAREARLFGTLVASPEAKELIGLFEATTALRKSTSEGEPRDIRRLGVVGGGFMGSGIASVSIPLVPVTVKEIDENVMRRCARGVYESATRRVKSGAITPFERDRQMARLRLTTNDDDLSRSDLVIETVFENLDLKREILAAVEARVLETCVIASNTSALPIAGIAARARHPERVLGMHYFSPVPKMQLLELIATPRTSSAALATARAFGARQGKTVVVVRDGPGFYTTRILSPYIDEAVALVAAGARIEEIDHALLAFGFPVGPLALLDEVGIDIAAHVGRTVGALLEARGSGKHDDYSRLIDGGILGRKSGRGFYRYEQTRAKSSARPVNEEAYALLGGKPRRTFPAAELADRTTLLMVNEAAHCLQEDVIASPRDGDVSAVLGLGFPPFRGGPFRYVDARGAGDVVDALNRLADANGARFAPAPILADMAQNRRSFHGERPGG